MLKSKNRINVFTGESNLVLIKFVSLLVLNFLQQWLYYVVTNSLEKPAATIFTVVSMLKMKAFGMELW